MNDEDRYLFNVLMDQYHVLNKLFVNGIKNERLQRFLVFYEDELFKK